MQDVPKIVLKRLQETAGAGVHPDADLLTAFAEQSLVESERARVMEHLSRCSDCREVVALAALPASEAAEVAASTRTSRSAWIRWPVLGWGVAVAGIIVIASVGIVQYRQRQKSEISSSDLIARNETTSTAVQSLPSSPAASELREVPPQAKKERQAETQKDALPRQDNSALEKTARPSNWNLSAARAMHGAVAGGGTQGNVAGGYAGGVAPKAALSSPPARDNSAAAGDLRNATPAEAAKLSPNLSGGAAVGVPSPTETVEVESQAAPVTATAENQASDQLIENKKEKPSQYKSSASLGVVEAKNFAAAQGASGLLLDSPRWSISAGGALRCSFDGGNTWVEVNVSSEPEASSSNIASTSGVESTHEMRKKKVNAQPGPVFRAVSALGAEVWAGGSTAMLYHSADSGAHWTRVLPSASGAVLTGNITSIQFSDLRHGKIATSTGEVWITADDGQTWQRQ